MNNKVKMNKMNNWNKIIISNEINNENNENENNNNNNNDNIMIIIIV